MPTWSFDDWQYLERQVVADPKGREWSVALMDVLGLPRTQACIRLLRRVADDYDRKGGVRRIVAHHIEERFAHLEDGTIEDERVGTLLDDPFIDSVREAGGDHVVPVVAQRKREQFGDLWCVINEEDPSRFHFLAAPAPGNRFFLPSDGSRSSTHTRPPAVK